MLEAKKPQFIRKSDFINYFTRSRDQWFFSETQLIDYIQSKIKKDFDVHEENDDYEYDYLDALRTAILNNETIDQRDPKVYEGTLIDKKSREYIKLKYIRLNAYDFDEIYKGIYDFKYLANETKKFLQKDNFILFQPVFIYRDKAVTRPDVLIKKNGEYTIMEVKSTTRPKSKHLVDLIYQHHVINDVLKIYDAQINDYLLCVVKYIKGVKNHIDFVITNRIPLVKGGKNLSEKRKRQFPGKLKYSDEAIEAQRLARLNNDSNVTIQNLMQLNVKELEIRKKQIYNEYVVPLLDTDYFDKIINELSHDIPVGEPSLEPDWEHFQTWFADCTLLPLIRKYYFTNDLFLAFHWSGKVLRLNQQYKIYQTNQSLNSEKLRNYMVGLKETYGRFFENFINNLYSCFNIGVYRTNETKALFSLLKPNKIYFDFESINPAICVIDDTTPYTQIVTQVSIIKDQCNSINIVVDPQKINVSDFKNMIDQIYHGDNYSYVVYNKSFECNRLNEMAVLINDVAYYKKVETINRHIYDLCDFFIPSNDLITIRELGGYYSIKNILPIIKRENPELFKQAGAVDYHDLKTIQHGSDALNQTSRRFFGLVDEKTWSQIVADLKAYCENDVRAMIAVELYIKHLLAFVEPNKN